MRLGGALHHLRRLGDPMTTTTNIAHEARHPAAQTRAILNSAAQMAKCYANVSPYHKTHILAPPLLS